MTGQIQPELVTPCVNLVNPDGTIPACTGEADCDIDWTQCMRLFNAQVRASRQTAIDVFFITKEPV